MADTSASLLERIREKPTNSDWQRIVDLYTPLIRSWLSRQARLQPGDVDDLVQEVLAVLVRRLPEFRPERPGSFRTWLRSITVNSLRHYWRSRQHRPLATGDSDFVAWLAELEDDGSGLSRLWDREHDEHVLRRLLDLIRPDFREKTWRAFERVALQGESPTAVARDLEMSPNAVMVAKSHVLSRLRQEAVGLID